MRFVLSVLTAATLLAGCAAMGPQPVGYRWIGEGAVPSQARLEQDYAQCEYEAQLAAVNNPPRQFHSAAPALTPFGRSLQAGIANLGTVGVNQDRLIDMCLRARGWELVVR